MAEIQENILYPWQQSSAGYCCSTMTSVAACQLLSAFPSPALWEESAPTWLTPDTFNQKASVFQLLSDHTCSFVYFWLKTAPSSDFRGLRWKKKKEVRGKEGKNAARKRWQNLRNWWKPLSFIVIEIYIKRAFPSNTSECFFSHNCAEKKRICFTIFRLTTDNNKKKKIKLSHLGKRKL